MKKINSFTNCYPISKTLRFSLLPIGKTEENFNNKLLLETDKKRAEEYKTVKKLIDRYHKFFIEQVLSGIYLEDVKEYASLYYKSIKTDNDVSIIEELESKMRKAIAKAFTSNKNFNSLFGKEIIQTILPEFLSSDTEIESVKMFHNFTTYFTGFHENRKNMYTSEPQTTAISFRCINDNLPKFLDNALSSKKILANLSEEVQNRLNDECLKLNGVFLKDIFDTDFFSLVLSQSGIDKYNSIIGGYTTDNGIKVQGINEYINLYNQQVAKTDKSKRLPLLKVLYKQILSDKESISFIPESFNSDNEVIESIRTFFNSDILEEIKKIPELFDQIESYNHKGIFVKSGLPVTELSNFVFGDWSAVSRAWNLEYEEKHPLKNIKNPDKYYEEQRNEYKKIKSFSVFELQRLGDITKSENTLGNIPKYYKETIKEKVENILDKYDIATMLLNQNYEENNDKKLSKNDNAISVIKELLDSVKELEKLMKPLLGTGKEVKDELFYGEFLPKYDSVAEIDKLYDKVRNYITKKPYSTDKIKLNFDNPQLLGGWDKNKERDYRTVILRKNEKYFLAIMDKCNSKAFINIPKSDEQEYYEKIEYKLLPGPNKMLPKVFFAASNIDTFAPDKSILEIRAKESFKKGANFSLDDCHKFIDFFKKSIEKHPDWSQFGFEFSPTDSYKDISEFYNEVKSQGYSIKFASVPESYINGLVDKGDLYLFQIYNKDFSEYSHGKKNLHTMYFEMLFNEDNLKNVVYQLNGGAEMFYREASIRKNERVIHPANQPVKNKNISNSKKESVFEYDIVKDKRYTKRQFSLHLPITLNFKADGKAYLNNDVRKVLKDSPDNYVIGIDRGERNLLYISVVNGKGEIVEQKSLNEIISGNGYSVDYHDLLDKKEKERESARVNWGTIENIKELKEGYLSQVVHEICNLVLKYDAIVAMEDLNFGFKKGRFSVEKQVYQKFENMLITKLNYLVDKNISADQNGGLLNAYQLTNKVDGVSKGRQNGFIFYVPAWLTSKIDPVTGFADLIRPKYTSVNESVKFIENIDDIRYNEAENIFEFDIDYSKFPKTNASYIKKWTICSNKDRIITFRNKDKNDSWDNKTIVLTEEFKTLFEKFNIDYKNVNIKDAILKQTTKEFYEKFIRLIGTTMQMRNSETGNVEVDYLISPVKDKNGEFYDSRNHKNHTLPENADANGAYNIARKALWAISVLKDTEDDMLQKANLSISNADWLEFVQR